MTKRRTQKIRNRQRRKLTIQKLNERALLAVIPVVPQGDDNPAALLSAAIQQANATPEADTIELASATYDLATLDNPTLNVDSEISIVGTSPTSTAIVGEPDQIAIKVGAEASLSLTRTAVYADAMEGGVIVIDGNARFDKVAVIGHRNVNVLSLNAFTGASTIQASGSFELVDSIITDSDGMAIHTKQSDGDASLQLTNAIITSANETAISGVAKQIEIDRSTIFNNRGGIFAAISDGSFAIRESTIADNFPEAETGEDRTPVRADQYAGVRVFSFASTTESTIELNSGEVTIGDDNIIVNNSADPTQPNIFVFGPNAPSFPKSIGTNEQATASLAEVTVEIVEGRLQTDLDLEGVNVDVVADGEELIVESRGWGRSSVFWNSATESFLVESSKRTISDAYPFSEDLPAIDAGSQIGNGAVATIDIPSILMREEASTLDRNAWQLLSIDSIESTSGASISVNQGYGPILTYRSIVGFAGMDTITITGRDFNGNVQEGIVTLDVKESSSVVVNVAASDLDEKIDVAISTSGFGNISSFDMRVAYDPAVVKLVDSKIGREFPFLQSVEDSGNGSIEASALGGFSRGNDLLTLNFERIGEGSAGIELLSNGFRGHVSGQSLPLTSFQQRYYYLDQDDANRSGDVTSSDALTMINRMAEGEATDAVSASSDQAPAYDRDLDANGDGKISASDPLRVINRLAVQQSGESEETTEPRHEIFADATLDLLVTGETIPSFVGRPEIPLDDGVPLDVVDLTPPTEEQRDSAIEVNVDSNGITLDRQLSSDEDRDVYAARASTLQIGLALDVIVDDNGSQTLPDSSSESPLTLAIFREDGTLIKGLPNSDSGRIFFDTIDTEPDELVYFRVGTTDSAFLNYRLELIAMN